MNDLEYISINPNVRFGKPCIKETIISVGDVLAWLASKMAIKNITSDYTQLN